MAGFGAGFTESLLAVTPFESIKTQLSVAFMFLFGEGLGSNHTWLVELMTASLEPLACAVSCTVARSFSKREVFEASSRALSLPQQDRLLTQLPGSRLTPH